ESRGAFDQATRLGGYRAGWVIPYAGLLARRVSPSAAVELYRSIPADKRTAAMEYEVMKPLLLEGKNDEAGASLAPASARAPRDRELVRLLVTVSGDSEAARAALERYRKAVGEDAGYLDARGDLLLRQGLLADAVTAYE